MWRLQRSGNQCVEITHSDVNVKRSKCILANEVESRTWLPDTCTLCTSHLLLPPVFLFLMP